VKAEIGIPVIANGDIDARARGAGSRRTGADAVMIGRAAQGRPWMFREIIHFLATGEHLPPPEVEEIHRVLRAHLEDLYAFYGEHTGVRVARKHISWYTKGLAGSAAFRTCHESAADLRRAASGRRRVFPGASGRTRRLQYIEELAA
jgi:tRNA-dihydrouridine synthase B